MFTIWYFLWNIVFFVYNVLFNVIVKFVFNKSTADLSATNNVLVKFLYNLNNTMSPVCVLSKNRNVLTNLNSFVNVRANSYPFVHEVTSVFDINTAKLVDLSQISFKTLYNEYSFYNSNVHFSNKLNIFLTKNLLNSSNSLLNHILLTNIIYNNFFLNLRYVGGLFEKSIYSCVFNFVLLLSLLRNVSKISNVSYVNVNFVSDLGSLYLASNNSFFKKLELANLPDLLVNKHVTYARYLSLYEQYSLNFVKSSNSLVNVFKGWSLSVHTSLVDKVNNLWVVKFSGSDITKYINGSALNNYVIYYLRKSKVFNKGRYSRNRQTYRTGAYWTIYVNIIAMIALTYWFYRFTINFGYVWWMLYIFMASFFLPKAIKYRFYNPSELFKSVVADVLWLGYQFNLVVSYINSLMVRVLVLLKKLI